MLKFLNNAIDTIRTKNVKQEQRLVRQQFFKEFSEPEHANTLPTIRGHELVTPLVDACEILTAYDVKLPGPMAEARVYKLTMAAITKMPENRKMQWDDFAAICKVNPKVATLRAEYEGNFAEKRGKHFEFVDKNFPILC